MSVFALKLLMLMFMKAPGHRKDTCPPRIRSLYTSIKKLIVVFTVLLFFSVMDTEAEAGVWKTVVGRGCLVYVHRHRQQIHFQRKGWFFFIGRCWSDIFNWRVMWCKEIWYEVIEIVKRVWFWIGWTMMCGTIDSGGLGVALELTEYGNVVAFCMHHHAVKHWWATSPRHPPPQLNDRKGMYPMHIEA